MSPSRLLLSALLALILLAVLSMSGAVGNEGSAEPQEEPVRSISVAEEHESVHYELPQTTAGDVLIEHEGYTLSFNVETNCPRWVAWSLSAEEVDGRQAHRVNDFRADPSVPEGHRAEPADYSGSGYDRGHMCPAADMKWSSRAMSECFYMSNICPQVPELNQRWWNTLENACRRWAKNEGEVYICCGPIFRDTRRKKTIGKTVQVRVPNAFFKVVLSMNEGNEKAIGFIYNNRASRQTMEETAVCVDSIESLTGLDFFHLLDDVVEERLEANGNLREWQ